MSHKVNLSPDPRILPMLGEINLSQERCLAELIDNSVDGFLYDSRLGNTGYTPEVTVSLPNFQDTIENAKILVRDNGPGMTPKVLENAVKAGWTSNDPVGNLGLFGMGFNIATARLGRITQVWTTKQGDTCWSGVEIDFQKMIDQKTFETELLSKPKHDSDISGTEVYVYKLKPEQLEWFKKPHNITKLKVFYSRIYSPLLRNPGSPIHFRLLISGYSIKPKLHCIWGDSSEVRQVVSSKYGTIDSLYIVNHSLPGRKYCLKCWTWLSLDASSCHVCGEDNQIVSRERTISGWVGILRYLSPTDYGIDFVRNGRKIEILDRSLFKWQDETSLEDEYPIDDPRRRGRIVGEIHLNHCRVSYTKDRFDRDDPAWAEMVRVVRGAGPLRPEKASGMGYAVNNSPLFMLFQAFRRSTPSSKVAGAYKNILAVKDNEMAMELAKKFDQGEAKFQTDEEWYKLVLEADDELLTSRPQQASHPVATGVSDPELSGIVTPVAPGGSPSSVPATTVVAEIVKQELIHGLSRDYVDDVSAMQFQLEAYNVEATHPKLNGNNQPWLLERESRGTYRFYIALDDMIFSSGTFRPIDALVTELSYTIAVFSRDRQSPPTFARIMSSLRSKYIRDNILDVVDLANDARTELLLVAMHLNNRYSADDNISLFNALSSYDKNLIISSMVSKGITNSQAIIEQGKFLEFSQHYTILNFVEAHPELYFDDNYWDIKYSKISYPDSDAENMARQRALRLVISLLQDVIWLSLQDEISNISSNDPELVRSSLSLAILKAHRND